MPTPEEIQKEGEAHFQALRDKVRELWGKMCAADNIPPESKFVYFSDKNPYHAQYTDAMMDLINARNIYNQAGYPGLLIHKARLARREGPHEPV